MNISLTRDMEKMIRDKVRGGMYQSASEVVREALRMLHDREKTYQQQLQELRAFIQEGVDDVEAGRVSEFKVDEFLAEMHRRYDRKKKQQESTARRSANGKTRRQGRRSKREAA